MFEIDKKLFHFINSTLSNPLFDKFMPWVTDLHKDTTALLIFSGLVLIWIYRKRWKILPVILGLSFCVCFTDLVNYRVFKPFFKKPRPPAIETEIQLRTERFAGYGFPSNHAANNFAAAIFLSNCYPALKWVYYSVATLIAFSRIYVGVHYPLDVIFGAFLGLFFGLCFFKISFGILCAILKTKASDSFFL